MTLNGSGPRIETPRLVLDLHRIEQLDALAEMWGDPNVVRHIGKPATAQESWMRLLRYRGLWSLLGYGYWAVTERASGRFVGDIGFADFHREITPAIRGIPEAGWVFAAWSHSRGYAREALAAALTWFERHAIHERCVCLIAPANEPSLRLAKGGGFRIDRTVTFNGAEALLLERPTAAAAN